VLLGMFRGLQVILGLLASFFIYQSSIFFYHTLKDHLQGENGVTQGLMVLYGGLIMAGLVTVAESIYKAFYVEESQ
jgi:hypothetical protein